MSGQGTRNMKGFPYKPPGLFLAMPVSCNYEIMHFFKKLDSRRALRIYFIVVTDRMRMILKKYLTKKFPLYKIERNKELYSHTI